MSSESAYGTVISVMMTDTYEEREIETEMNLVNNTDAVGVGVGVDDEAVKKKKKNEKVSVFETAHFQALEIEGI
jgi:hypothetical protein